MIVVSHFYLSLLLLFMIAGCGGQKTSRLGAGDLRFAALYSDYLSRSGFEGGMVDFRPEQGSIDPDTLFARHGLDRKRVDERLRAYSHDPVLWRRVLESVRANLRKME